MILRPDYSLTTRQLYKKVVALCIEASQSLDVLSYVYGTRNLVLDMPSYVPDWTASIAQKDHRLFVGRCIILYSNSYYASTKSVPQFSISADGTAHTGGILFDVIAECGEYTDTDSDIGKTELDEFSKIAGLCDREDTPYQSRVNAFWRTMCEGVISKLDDSHDSVQAVESSDLPVFTRWFTWMISSDLGDVDTYRFHTSFTSVSVGRKFIITKQGYIGWAPKDCQKGDHIVLLSGGNVPYILRPYSDSGMATTRASRVWPKVFPASRDRCYTFLGDAYVHGIMHGEGYSESKIETIKMI
jgi:hypothetical protein